MFILLGRMREKDPDVSEASKWHALTGTATDETGYLDTDLGLSLIHICVFSVVWNRLSVINSTQS